MLEVHECMICICIQQPVACFLLILICNNHTWVELLQTIESTRAQDKIEIEHLQELVSRAKEKADRDKEALKKATR